MADEGSSKRVIKGAIAAIVLVVAVAYIASYFRSQGGTSPNVYFYDLNTKQLFGLPAIDLPPVESGGTRFEGEPAGVRAIVFSCGDCAKPGDRTIAWLVKFAADFKKDHATYDQLLELQSEDYKGQHLTKRPDDAVWVDVYSSEGQAIQQVPKCPDGSAAKECLP